MSYLDVVTAHTLTQPVGARCHICQVRLVDCADAVVESKLNPVPICTEIVNVVAVNVVIAQSENSVQVIRERPSLVEGVPRRRVRHQWSGGIWQLPRRILTSKDLLQRPLDSNGIVCAKEYGRDRYSEVTRPDQFVTPCAVHQSRSPIGDCAVGPPSRVEVLEQSLVVDWHERVTMVRGDGTKLIGVCTLYGVSIRRYLIACTEGPTYQHTRLD